MSTAMAQTELANQYILMHQYQQQKLEIEKKTKPMAYTSIPEGVTLEKKICNTSIRIRKFEAILSVKK